MRIRKMLTVIEEILEDGGRAAARPIKKVAAVAVIENPFAGRYVEDLAELVKTGEELGDLLGRRAVAALGAPVHSYGKAAVIGVNGEYEHAAAILHPTLGTPFRAAVDGGKAIIPSAKKLGGPGTAIDVPLHYKDDAFVRTPLRRHGGAPGRRAEGERDPGRPRRHRRRPPPRARRRPHRGRGQEGRTR